MTRPLTEGEHTAVSVVTAAVGALGLIGFVISFATVAQAAEPAFGRLAFLLPLGVDLGIGVFAALDIVLARLDMRVRWLRLIPWTLTAATVYLNVATQADVFGMVAHAVLPLLWVVAVEVGAHVIRKRANLANPARMDRIRSSRWVLAPISTGLLWRRMVLWEIRSYGDALDRERERVLATIDLHDRYGRLWRFKASRRERALYRLGELTPAAGPAVVPVPPTGRRADVDDLMPLGWQILADHDAVGTPLTRDRLRDAVRETGQSISTDRAGALLARLRSETPPRRSARFKAHEVTS
ncbi:DUF2637 domain-containing protein [Herbidospora cretacea]|uniref:DUF2637 domain-containing protein n=1 Tax=Herbidospora cretacea TaxID=28444 RepID=UPI00068C42EB|nr:DUF2637 domain-containing protein [Herbidospora cretacea]